MNVFFVYTLRDGLVTKSKLVSLKKALSQISSHKFYIDIVDNQSIVNNFQSIVMDNLSNATVSCVVLSPTLRYSPWARKELSIIGKKRIPRLDLSLPEFDSLSTGNPEAISTFISQLNKISTQRAEQ